MRIIEHNPNVRNTRDGMMFTDTIHFKFPTNLRLDPIEQDLNSVCDWVANTFSENYVVMEYMDRRIAGGWGEMSKQGWEDAGRKVDRSEEPFITYYELRCYSKDATLFLLKWS